MTTKFILNPITGKLDKISVYGGLYGINVETLTGDKTLTPNTDKIYQYLDEGGADRIITLATVGAVAGDVFVIKYNGGFTDAYTLIVRQSAITLDSIYTGQIKEFIFDGTNWTNRGVGTGENDNRKLNLGIGYSAVAYTYGTAIGGGTQGNSYAVAVGYGANAYDFGVAIGMSSTGYSSGVGIGYNARGANSGIAIGYLTNTNGKVYSIALGYYSRCIRYAETSINIDGNSDQKNNAIQIRFTKTTTDATEAEMLTGGVTFPVERCTIRASSHLAFQGLVVARNNVDNVGMAWKFEGLIKRDASNNTALVAAVTPTEIAKDGALAWSITVTADDTNEALVIKVTGEAAKTIQWAGYIDGVETHF